MVPIKINDASFQREMLKDGENELEQLKFLYNNGRLSMQELTTRVKIVKTKLHTIKKGYFP